MTNKDDKPSDLELRENLRTYGKKAAEGLFSSDGKGALDERELTSGSEELLEKSDGEQFPDELEEHTPEERRKKLAVAKATRKSNFGVDGK